MRNRNTDKYNLLLNDLDDMISTQGRGYNVAQKMNDAFWEELGTHRIRMQEQIDRVNSVTDEELEAEMSSADSVYEATRNYIAKYK